MTHAELAQLLRAAVLAQHFEATPDHALGGAPLRQFPSIDLAVAAFAPGTAPVWANVLFSREHPQGLVGEIDAQAAALRNVSWLADQRDSAGDSPAWAPDADWAALEWLPLAGQGEHRVVAPYPASLVKLMVLVGVARAVDQGHLEWDQVRAHGDASRSVANWAFEMIATSCNAATEALVALLHEVGAIRREGGVERFNALHTLFDALGLPTLRLANTRPDGGWRNADGAGVGQLQMTAWDTLRLLWLIDPEAPPAPWLARRSRPLLSAESRAWVMHCLGQQGLHEVLSSGLLAGLPGWVAGLPAQLPSRWLRRGGTASVGEHDYPGDLRTQTEGGTLNFAHKTGTTDNYASDAGIVHSLRPGGRHYLVAMISSLGRRYAPDPCCATTWKLPALGAAIDAALRERLES